MTFRHQFFKIHKQKWRKNSQLDRCKKIKTLNFSDFQKCRFFAPRNLFEAPVRAPTKPKKLARKPFFRNDSNHEPNSKANRTSKKNGTQRAKTSKKDQSNKQTSKNDAK